MKQAGRWKHSYATDALCPDFIVIAIVAEILTEIVTKRQDMTYFVVRLLYFMLSLLCACTCTGLTLVYI